MTPKVSILIPCYNSQEWIESAIASALEQTWKSIEIIVVDDGSTDESLERARKFDLPEVKLIAQSNQGASRARNVAFENCSGDYIQYLDADDILHPTKIEIQLSFLEEYSTSPHIASCPWGGFTSNTGEATFIQQPAWSDLPSLDWLVSSWEGGGMMHPAAWLTPRSVIEQAGPWNEELSLNDDGEFFTRVLLASQGVIHCQEAKSYYRTGHPGRLSSTQTSQAWLSAYTAVELSTQALLETEDSQRTRHACASAFQRFCYTAYPHSRDLIAQAEKRVVELGGTDLRIEGGARFQRIASLFGWKCAKRLQGWIG